jgi:HSP20 family molecular chaperone IbpA
MTDIKELQVKDKQEVASPAEQTQPGLVFTPAVDIFETEQDITLLADMPGVTANNIGIDLKEGVLTFTGNVSPWESREESDLLVEFEVGKYYRQFALSDIIAQDRIQAKFEDGTLRLSLPKAEKAIPRQITVTAG